MEEDVEGAPSGGGAPASAAPSSPSSTPARGWAPGSVVGPTSGASPGPAQELPFLVTHWLANYGSAGGAAAATAAGGSAGGGEREGGREEALRRLRRAASEVASAFAALGAYGSTVNAPLGGLGTVACSGGPTDAESRQLTLRNATFSDLNRRWADLAPNHLEAVVESSAAATSMANQLALSRARPSSILDAAYEEGPSSGAAASSRSGKAGRRVGRRIAQATSSDGRDDSSAAVATILQPPALLEIPTAPSPSSGRQRLGQISSLAADFVGAVGETVDEAREDILAAGLGSLGGPEAEALLPQRLVAAAVGSDLARSGARAAAASRRCLDLRARLDSEGAEVRSTERAIASQKRTREEMTRRRDVAEAVVEHSSGAAAAAARAEAASMAATSGSELDLTKIDSRLQDAERVIAQLGRRLEELQATRRRTEAEFEEASLEARNLWSAYASLQRKYHDPFSQTAGPSSSLSSSSLPIPFSACGSRAGSLLSAVIGRQHCAGGSWRQASSALRPVGRIPSRTSLMQNRKSILMQRMSHAVTVNCHLFYPVFCLKFDKTGRYFLTGADDHLVKLFHLGAGVSNAGRDRGGTMRFNYGANYRGAVLVCTLRGHAGVITDIDVSADNALLATASEDGDVRIWGLRDGCPVAILRGHNGGANMISWSVLSPYRLVTTGEDGLARIWDVREAALKRYGSIIGKRSDYVLPKVHGTDDSSSEEEEEEEEELDVEEEDDFLPPIPLRAQEEADTGGGVSAETNGHANPPPADAVVENDPENADNNERDNNNANGVVVPPLPPGAEGSGVGGLVGAGNIANGSGRNNGGANPGAFIANDSIDEGVRLIAKLQHGEMISDGQLQGPSTRSQRKAVKVVCVARCPVGGHFATGSDDGLGRVWADEDDGHIARLDAIARGQDGHHGKGISELQSEPSSSGKGGRSGRRKSGRLRSMRHGSNGAVVPSRSTLLATLHGHLNSITDIKYSNAGDRILTASLKDGVVRIWSWGTESASVETDVQANLTRSPRGAGGAGKVRFDSIKQILIRLTPPSDSSAASSAPARSTNTSSARRRGGSSSGGTSANRSEALDVVCDIAVWTSDDSKIVTSQCIQVKDTGQDIVPGSQILHVWDSRTGQCLLGLPPAHDAPVPVLVPHPLDPSILASAGGDGRVNVWDLDAGKAFFSHRNTLTHGHIDPPNARGKNCGYLDGSFSPDGLSMVLTDDAGRIIVIDTLCSAETVRKLKLASTSSSVSRSEEGTSLNPITLFTEGRQLVSSMASSSDAPTWMKEQYCANDYYEMIYDVNGYCVERGSAQPPHLAPKAVRCTHTGTPHQDFVTEAFSKMFGPLPLPEAQNRWERDDVRMRGIEVRKDSGLLSQNVHGKRTAINVDSVDVGRYGARSSMTSLLKRMGASVGDQSRQSVATSSRGSASAPASSSSNSPRRSPNRTSSSSGRALSTNFRWMDYDDVLREEGQDDDGDTDDEEYDEAPRGRRLNADDDDDGSESSDAMDLDDDDYSSRSSRRSSGNRRNRSEGSSGRSQRRDRPRGSSARSQRRGRRTHSRDQSVRFEEMAQRQPSRISSRQGGASRRVYEDPDSSDEDLVELMSTNTTPSGEYVEDYTVLGHLFRVPEGYEVNRAWLSRMESHSGMCGKRAYAPQVGDSVVYIPKAHYDTIKSFPTGNNSSAPWKSWPNSSAWPVVRCAIQNIRYRFPYEQYYRHRGGNSVSSVVAILTLEVTGIPLISSDGMFPWPKPEFISRQTRSSSITFEVSVFESGEIEFIVPEHLYTWKIATLESAIRACNDVPDGLELKVHFAPSEGEEGADTEDPELIPHACTVTSLNFSRRDREIHFQNSGYNALSLVWENEDTGVAAAWEVVVADKLDDIPPPPSLSEDELSALTKVLDELEEDPLVESWFVHPVDTRKYTDYLNMIEIPMDLSIIRKRLDGGYYTNILSVAADVKLIRENCVKYNERHSDIAEAAYNLHDRFQERCNDIQQRTASSPQRNRRRAQNELSLLDSSPRPSSRSTRRSITAAHSSAPPQEGAPTRTSSRLLRSSLESLPPPAASTEESDADSNHDADSSDDDASCGHEGGPVRRQVRVRASTRTRATSPPAVSSRATRASAASKATANEGESDGYQTPQSDEDGGEEAESDGGGQPSGRRRTSSRAAAASSTQEVARSKRSSPRKAKVSYKEVDSDADEVEEEEEEEKEEVGNLSGRRRASSRATATSSTLEVTRSTRSSPRKVSYKEVDSDADEVEEEEEEQEEEEEEEEKPPKAISQRAAASRGSRSSPRTQKPSTVKYEDIYSEGEEEEEEEEEDEKEEEEEEPPRKRISKRTAASIASRSSPRARKRSNVKYEDVDSDFEEYQESENDEEESESEDENEPPRGRRGTKRPTVGSRRASPRKQPARRRQDSSSDEDESIGEDESSDGGDDGAGSVSSDDFVPSSSRGGRQSSKRRKATSARNASSTKKSRTQSGDLYYPTLSKWPPIVHIRHITRVSKRILKVLAEADSDGIFARPVPEAYPEVADTYLSCVANPMDFRTILEERVPVYADMSELQDDLILVFRNCCTFNGEGTEYYHYAINIWKGLNDVFKQVCEEEGIEMPRRWG